MRQTKLRIVYWPSRLPYFICTHGKQFYQTSKYSLRKCIYKALRPP